MVDVVGLAVVVFTGLVDLGVVDGEWCAHGNDFVAGSSPADTV